MLMVLLFSAEDCQAVFLVLETWCNMRHMVGPQCADMCSKNENEKISIFSYYCISLWLWGSNFTHLILSSYFMQRLMLETQIDSIHMLKCVHSSSRGGDLDEWMKYAVRTQEGHTPCYIMLAFFWTCCLKSPLASTLVL